MMNILMLTLIPFMITLLLIFINKTLSFKSTKDREKPSPFECGFNPITNARLPFSNQFFMISIIFLIFDIEIILLMPMIPAQIMNKNHFYWMNTIFFIFITLLLGLLYEWNEQSLTWIK
nr:NADH dehydrogenase subunit 3 [Symmorphus murarius]